MVTQEAVKALSLDPIFSLGGIFLFCCRKSWKAGSGRGILQTPGPGAGFSGFGSFVSWSRPQIPISPWDLNHPLAYNVWGVRHH